MNIGMVGWEKRAAADDASETSELVPVTGGVLHVVRFFDADTGQTLGPNPYGKSTLPTTMTGHLNVHETSATWNLFSYHEYWSG